jgi:aldehyde:ferredoxin oxidoreductase
MPDCRGNGKMTYRLVKYDLTDNVLEEVKVAEDLYRDFVGGAGLSAVLLYPILTSSLDPLGIEAPLLLATGPLTGTKGPAVGRFTICGKSPATGIWGESNIGGFAGPELRSAGFNGLWITGRATSPVYLWVTEGRIEIRSAGHLWGRTDTYETQDAIKQELGEPSAKVLTIGLAGENLLPFSVILSDHGRVAGRTGMGAIMGSKQIKAIAIRGKSAIPLHSTDEFTSLRSKVNRELRADMVSKGFKDFGTASASDIFDFFGMMPKKYFSSGTLEGTEKVSGPSLSETILSGVSTCHGCVIACGRKVKLRDGIERKGPEYETTVGFGPNLGITDLDAITRMGERCDQLGMDIISLSNTIGLCCLLYQEGKLRETDTGGEAFLWGDSDVVFHMIEATARREGFGAEIAKGAATLATQFGAAGSAAVVRGLEMPFHDPRGATGVALVYATSPRGACHNQSQYYLVEIGQTIEEIGVDLLDRQDVERKSRNVALHQSWVSVLNSLVMCIFANVPPHETTEFLNLSTGWDYSVDELMLTGERIWNIKRLINHRLGVQGSSDRLPEHVCNPLEDGGASGIVPPIDGLLARYYEVRGWDSETGEPTQQTISKLGLDRYLSA